LTVVARLPTVDSGGRATSVGEPVSDTHRYYVRGDLDFDAAPQLRVELVALADDFTVKVIVLDCRDLTFIDSAGFHVLLDLQRMLEGQGRHMQIENLSRSLHHVFDVVGLTGVLRVHG
jgi:anti-anti-sigma factor